MINFKDVVERSSPEKANSIITIEGNPVWDYKATGFTVFLISEDPWVGSEDEHVTLGELKSYIVSNEIPFDEVKFATEADKEVLKSVKWESMELNFSH